MPTHDLVASDGRSFWLTYPAARRDSRKIRRFHRWLEVEAAEERAASARYIAAAVVMGPAA